MISHFTNFKVTLKFQQVSKLKKVPAPEPPIEHMEDSVPEETSPIDKVILKVEMPEPEQAAAPSDEAPASVDTIKVCVSIFFCN